MKKIVGVIGTRGAVYKFSYQDTDNLLKKVGGNTGNLFFQYAVTQVLDEEYYVLGEDIPWDLKSIQENCKILVIPSANFLKENLDFTDFVSFLDKLELPLVFLGLGAQAKDYNQKEFDFHPSILRLIDLLKERTIKIGLRGEFTQRLLERFGVTNTEVIGCPSNFVNTDPNFVNKLKMKTLNEIESFLVTGDEPWPKNPLKRDAERKMIQWANKGAGLFVQQSVEPFIRYGRRKNLYQTATIPEHHESSLRKSLAPDMTDEEFRAFIAVKYRIYYSIEQWLEDAARVDFSTGLRLHGNMAAWQSGTPAVWIYHDSRTRELVETMALPHLSLEQFLECKTLNDVRDMAEFDFDQYEATRRVLIEKYQTVLSKASIKNILNSAHALRDYGNGMQKI
ncbi:MAG: polysaccharide pyruvyl transferase family protein [Limnospira sp. PMC 1279.21]|uniref:polysaccharide pyruvyl transferase family protein n=1 Tax=unclassified Limnospira TaxID=2642885 RepID=UPI0028E15539|nr:MULTISPECIES: polysaccharide pyruvyl transferase family protein [unclassified Limnospira]MDT9180183.1 polysaccharide pyruvyl transferase family protein [Limnospira sp. PMC 1238.20]MDT9195498.1 polysaccharide pyruvyl transferase family protein [Limnospira sp. PMC 1245.20]MDT9205753.1 polysaccharide pyruvyl transferase family protein [Limnospira sp. PMC 1243.20]MDT9210916.1 polysaccharide pyruvyl transferase family protein [Limnospira sp. PMC 1252.20]MDT9215984.1 polysaccharide pyruvyl transf